MHTKSIKKKRRVCRPQTRAEMYPTAAGLDDGRGPDPAAVNAEIERRLKKFKHRKGETGPEMAHRLAVEVGIDPHGTPIDDWSA